MSLPSSTKDLGGDAEPNAMLSPQEVLAGGLLVHDVTIPPAVLNPAQASAPGGARRVRLRPLKVATLALIAKAAHDDASLVPVLIVKESLVEPALSFDQVRQLHAGLVQFLLAEINRISGLDADGGAARAAASSAIGEAHVLLARHSGWTPAQVAELSPGQIAVYLAGLREDEGGGPA
jgi:xanthine/CO dehydrogenase XdhC/CoxF family maturation factor